MRCHNVYKYFSSVLKILIHSLTWPFRSLWKPTSSLLPMQSALDIIKQPYYLYSAIVMAASPSTPTSSEVYLLPLTDGGAPDVPGGYIYLPPPSDPAYTVRFAIEGTSSVCREGSLWVNAPVAGEPFQRDNFREYK